MTDRLLSEYYARREVWRAKPQIRFVYERWLKKIAPRRPAGPVLEVGSGSGLLRDLIPDAILTDVVFLPWLDCVCDGGRLPFRSGSLGAAVLLDMLHHVPAPHDFLEELGRVLRPGGKILLIEPHITFGSYFGYRLLHHEKVDFRDTRAIPGSQAATDAANPWDGNLAMSNLVFARALDEWPRLHPNLKITHRELFSFFDFQCAGGFKPYALAPMWLFKGLCQLDNWLGPLMPITAFRIFAVIERQ